MPARARAPEYHGAVVDLGTSVRTLSGAPVGAREHDLRPLGALADRADDGAQEVALRVASRGMLLRGESLERPLQDESPVEALDEDVVTSRRGCCIGVEDFALASGLSERAPAWRSRGVRPRTSAFGNSIDIDFDFRPRRRSFGVAIEIQSRDR